VQIHRKIVIVIILSAGNLFIEPFVNPGVYANLIQLHKLTKKKCIYNHLKSTLSGPVFVHYYQRIPPSFYRYDAVVW